MPNTDSACKPQNDITQKQHAGATHLAPLTDAEFQEISEYMDANYGVNFSRKKHLVEGRLGHYVASLGFANYHDYFMHVKNDRSRKMIAHLLNRLTTNHTFFMREREHFEFYRDTVLPWVVDELRETDLRVWSAGCSYGQEPYTLSIFTLDYLAGRGGAGRGKNFDSVILATDISEQALSFAREGVYPLSELSALPESWLARWFDRTDENNSGDRATWGHDEYHKEKHDGDHSGIHYKANKALRSNVAFKCFNLLDEFDVKKPFHLIMCRNVMIFFGNETKERLVEKFYNALLPGGYLFIGHSESIAMLQTGFEYIKPSIYRKPLC